MSDRPIIFSAPMVRALLDGRKTQTRRVLKPQPPEWATFCQQPAMLNALHQWVPSGLWRWSELEQNPPRPLREWPLDADGRHFWKRLPYAIGDRLWVRESLAATAEEGIAYRADGAEMPTTPWQWGREYLPSIHMPRWASRLMLTVTDVRVQRLQEIGRGDALEEGCPFTNMAAGPNPRDWFRELWESIHGAEAWTANPWIVALTFTVERRNIDA